MNNVNDTIETIIKEFLIEKVNPYFIIIFGSYAKEILRADSDIDIAFLSENSFDSYDLFMISQELASIIKKDVDLIDLNNASTVFRAQIIGTGKLIYSIDENKRMYFFMKSFKEYAKLNEERKVIIDKYLAK
ncbi:MAG: nucleotidyltransferase domain-containing protein [Clostridiales bacterium]|nr:nucleotidyltransferase domain-containing protein [Clostridiales bacterium]